MTAQTSTDPAAKPTRRTPPPQALSAEERTAVLALMNSPAYAESAPAQIWARELDEGRYHCSVATMYRILREHGQAGERRRTRQTRARSSHYWKRWLRHNVIQV